VLYQGDDVRLTGFRVLSNSTGMVHAEQMIDLGGSITMSSVGERTSVTNQTDHDLVDTVIVRRTMHDQVQVAWPGALPSKQRRTVTFHPWKSSRVAFPEREEAIEGAGRQSVEEGLDIRPLIDVATDPHRLGLGEAVLVGWNDLTMPGMKIRPSAAQVTVRTVFVVQLSHAARPRAVRDANSYEALLRSKREQSDSEENGVIF